jgi:hypothetical protein
VGCILYAGVSKRSFWTRILVCLKISYNELCLVSRAEYKDVLRLDPVNHLERCWKSDCYYVWPMISTRSVPVPVPKLPEYWPTLILFECQLAYQRLRQREAALYLTSSLQIKRPGFMTLRLRQMLRPYLEVSSTLEVSCQCQRRDVHFQRMSPGCKCLYLRERLDKE